MEQLTNVVGILEQMDLEQRMQAYRVQVHQKILDVDQRLFYETQVISPEGLEGLTPLDEKTFKPLYKDFKTTLENIAQTIGYFQTTQKNITPLTIGAGGLVGTAVATGVFLGTGIVFPFLLAPLVGIAWAPPIKHAYTHFRTKQYLKRYEELPEKMQTLLELTNSLEDFMVHQKERGEKFIQGYSGVHRSATETLGHASNIHTLYSTLVKLKYELENPSMDAVKKTKLGPFT